MPVETVKFQTNIPEVVALQYTEGRPVPGKFGDQIMFTLVDGRKMYLSPFVADKIHGANISRGVPFSICKREVTHGNRRTVEFEIETPNAPNAATAAVLPAAAAAVSQPTMTTTKSQEVPHNTVPASHPPTIEGNAVALLALSGRAAIDAVLATEEYAKERGLTDFAFGAENIQKVWMSLYIELNRKGARS